MIENIRFLGHGSFLIQDSPIIYINPWRVLAKAFHADVVLITHDHSDHFSLTDVERVSGEHTQIITNAKVAQELPRATIIRPYQYMQFDRAMVRALPAYATEDLRHKREDGGLGFIISLNYYDIYYTGDTKLTPEMKTIQPDILILPIDDDGTFSLHEAVEAVELMRPRWVFPCNWGGTNEGVTAREAIRFKELVGGRTEVILQGLEN